MWVVSQAKGHKREDLHCLPNGQAPERIQQQPVHSTNMNTIVPEKTVSRLPPRSHLSLHMGEGARLQYMLLYTLEILQCGVFYQTIINNVSCSLEKTSVCDEVR